MDVDRLLRPLDDLLNRITMYRLLVYGLAGLAGISLLWSGFGLLHLSVLGMVLSLSLLVVGSYGTNWFLSRAWRVPANSESWLIAALILFFLLPPPATLSQAALVLAAGMTAIASKFIVAYRGRHIFNPAAFAAGLFVLAGLVHPTWWVGSSALWPLVALLGALVVRKIRRTYVAVIFGLASVAIMVLPSLLQQQEISSLVQLAITSSPLLFLGTIMLTEPATMPHRRVHQVLFALLVGGLYAWQLNINGVYIYPELALLIGNVYAFIVNWSPGIRLRLKAVYPVSAQVADYVFEPDRPLRFLPGQYLEWTLPGVAFDSRGNRRTFTIASSPTETDIHLGVKFYEPASAFKRRLRALRPGDVLYANHLAGNFTLPGDPDRKLVFIAGGIGITPFRSMLKYLLDSGQQRDIVLFYLVKRAEEVAYKDVLRAAVDAGICVVGIQVGRGLTVDLIRKSIPDWHERTFYLSGPYPMVRGIESALGELGVPPRCVKKDYFTGY